ncbi:MAG: hypothetical protein NW703_13190 [Nitrospiraceae bacterium]
MLHDKYPQAVDATELVPLVFQILRYKMADAHRKALRRREYHQASIDDLPLADQTDDPAFGLERKQGVERLVNAMAQLGERCRELFKWKLEGKTFPEIQRLMGQVGVRGAECEVIRVR